MYAIYSNMDPINIPQMLAYIYIPYMDPMVNDNIVMLPSGYLTQPWKMAHL